MSTSARTSTPSPSQSPSPAAPAAASADEQPAETLHAQRTQVGVIGSFSLACLCACGACCMALGHVAPWGLPPSAAIPCAVALAIVFTGIGLALAMRGQHLRVQRIHRETRAEQIQHELDMLDLTAKEMPIARLILQHRSYQEIADQCHLSQRTVQFHASNIFRKAYVSRRRDFERVMLAEQSAAANAADTSARQAGATGADVRQTGAREQTGTTIVRLGTTDFARTQNAGPLVSAHTSQHAAAPVCPTFPDATRRDVGAGPQQRPVAVLEPRGAYPRQASPRVFEEQWFSTHLAKTPTTARSRFALQQKSTCSHRERERSIDLP